MPGSRSCPRGVALRSPRKRDLPGLKPYLSPTCPRLQGSEVASLQTPGGRSRREALVPSLGLLPYPPTSPGRPPWLSPNPLMSSVKTPGSLSMRHHSPALPVMAPAARRPAPPPAPGAHGPRSCHRRALSSANPPRARPPHVTPPTSRQPPRRRHLERDRTRVDALATREPARLSLHRSGPGADSEAVGGGRTGQKPRKGGAWGP